MTASPRHLHLANARYSQNTSTHAAAEITKLIRLYYDPATAPPYKFQKVCQKTSRTLQYERPENTWEGNYRRRSNHFQCGYYSVPNEPYKNLGGDFDLDPYDLVINTLTDNLSPKIWEAKKAGTTTKQKKRRQSFLPSLQPVTSQPSKNLEEEEKACDCDGGRYAIREQLKDMEKTKQLVRCGQPFEEHIQYLQDLKLMRGKPTKSGNQMVLIPMDSPFLLVDTPCSERPSPQKDITMIVPPSGRVTINEDFQVIYPDASPVQSDVSVNSESDAETPVYIPEKRKKSMYLRSATSLLAVIDPQASVRERKKRAKRIHMEYLRALNIVMNSLHNMKTKDIKSKNPLSEDYLKQLRMDTVPLHGDSRFPGKNRPTKTLSVLTVQSSTDTKNSSMASIFSKKKTSNMFEQMAMLPTKMGAKSKLDKLRLFKSKTADENIPNLETWEDLLAVDPAAHVPQRQKRKSFATGVQILVKAVQWQRRLSESPQANNVTQSVVASPVQGSKPGGKSTPVSETQDTTTKIENLARHLHTEQKKAQKKTPIWQKVAAEKTEVYEVPVKKRSKEEETNPEDVVGNMQAKFFKLKNKHKLQMDAEVHKMESERLRLFRYKYGLFEDMSPVFDQHVAKLQTARGNIHENVPSSEVKASLWYEDLEEKAHKICGHGRDITDLLQLIGQHATMDSRSIYQCKAKLCLLVMSLPSNEICTVAFQTAIKFVLEAIMLQDLKNFLDWIELRKVPYNVYDKKETENRDP